ncbi:hypothetical protein [Actinophytocola sediminis]
MTEPQPVMDQAEQDRLVRQIGRALLTVAGQDWTQLRAEYRAAGRHIEVDVFVSGPDNQPRQVRPPQEVVDGLGKLRQGMYRPGRGTWLSALYQLDPPSTFNAEFEPDEEPRWRRVPPPIGFADELRFFPREDEHIPDWFRQRAGLPPAEGEHPAGQADQRSMPTPASGLRQPGHATPPGGVQQPGNPTPAHGFPPPGGAQSPGHASPPGRTQQPGHATGPGGFPQPGHATGPGGFPQPANATPPRGTQQSAYRHGAPPPHHNGRTT